MPDKIPYQLTLSQRALETLRGLDKSVAKRIIRKLAWLTENAETVGHEMLTGQWHGYFRWRVGDYRILYILDHEERLIDVALIGHRSDIYDE
jgi:mRNA interferase RelE/StbE